MGSIIPNSSVLSTKKMKNVQSSPLPIRPNDLHRGALRQPQVELLPTKLIILKIIAPFRCEPRSPLSPKSVLLYVSIGGKRRTTLETWQNQPAAIFLCGVRFQLAIGDCSPQ